MIPTCRCGQPAPDTTICGRCEETLARDLGDVAALVEDLTITLARQDRIGERSIGRSSDKPMPFHVKAGTVLADLHARLGSWVSALHDERTGYAGPTHERCGHASCGRIRPWPWPADNPTALAAWLLTYMWRIRRHPAADEMCDEIHATMSDAKRAVDAPANRTAFPVGPCPEVLEDDSACPGEVRAYIPWEETKPARMECGYCHTLYEPHQWLRAGKRILTQQERRCS